MRFSLWRGDQRVGEMVAALPTKGPGLVAGLFKPAAEVGSLEPMIQVRSPSFVRGRPVFLKKTSRTSRSGVHPLRELSAKEALGLPVEEQLVIRDAHGEIVEADMISLSREGRTLDRGEFHELCVAHGIDGKPWILGARLPDAADNAF